MFAIGGGQEGTLQALAVADFDLSLPISVVQLGGAGRHLQFETLHFSLHISR